MLNAVDQLLCQLQGEIYFDVFIFGAVEKPEIIKHCVGKVLHILLRSGCLVAKHRLSHAELCSGLTSTRRRLILRSSASRTLNLTFW